MKALLLMLLVSFGAGHGLKAYGSPAEKHVEALQARAIEKISGWIAVG